MEEKPSKSHQKREATALQKLGEELSALNASELASLELPETLLDALTAAGKIKSHGAKRRQFQLIGALMRRLDSEVVDTLISQLKAFKEGSIQDTKLLHQVEIWRDRLLTDENSLTEFLKLYDCEDRQQLRQAIAKAKKERENQQNLGGAKALFKLLRGIIVDFDK